MFFFILFLIYFFFYFQEKIEFLIKQPTDMTKSHQENCVTILYDIRDNIKDLKTYSFDCRCVEHIKCIRITYHIKIIRNEEFIHDLKAKTYKK